MTESVSLGLPPSTRNLLSVAVAQTRVSVPHTVCLVPVQCADEQSRSDGEHGDARGDFARIVLRERLRFVAVGLQVVPCRIEVLIDVDVLHRGLEVVDHVVADAEAPEELLESAVERLTATGTCLRRVAA